MLPENDEPYELTDSEKNVRVLYVNEWCVDQDWFNAAVRIGYTGEAAKTISKLFSEDPYVLQLIAKGEKENSSLDPSDDKDASRRRIKAALLREANYRGFGSSHSARVSALKTLLDLEGLVSPQKLEAELTTPDNKQVDLSNLSDKELQAYHLILSKLNKK